MLTARDRQYLRAVFKLKGFSKHVGPQELANVIGVTRVCAFQKMRRLEVLGMGEYAVRKGLRLNHEGVSVVEEEIRRHHVLERFLMETLKMSSKDACDHSTHMGPFVCDEVLSGMTDTLGNVECDCGHCLHECNGHQAAAECHWLKKNV